MGVELTGKGPSTCCVVIPKVDLDLPPRPETLSPMQKRLQEAEIDVQFSCCVLHVDVP